MKTNNRKRNPNGTFSSEGSRDKAISAGLKHYVGVDCPLGHGGLRFVSNNGCVECLKLHNKKYHGKNRESRLLYMSRMAKEKPKENAERSRRWYHASDENKKKAREVSARWRAANIEHVKVKARIYSQNRRKRLVIPAWANKEAIEKIYRNCPSGMTVDHIVPIAGKKVCGLHVENNLQYLTRSENSRKGAKWDEKIIRRFWHKHLA